MASPVSIPISRVVIDPQTQAEVVKVLQSGNIVWGQKVAALETAFASLCDVPHAVAVTSGTSALHTALSVMGVGYGDEVITTPFTYVATANTIALTGATPVFVDIDPHTYNLNPDLVEQAITPRTKAILSVDLYGLPVNYRRLRAIAKAHHLIFISDAAQAVGAEFNHRPVGSLADITCFSLYATKNLMAGEGGMLTTQSQGLDTKIRRFRNHGESHGLNYAYQGIGHNYCPTDIMATIALGQLNHFPDNASRRRHIAAHYLSQLNGIEGLILPYTPPNFLQAYHQFTLRLTAKYPLSRDQFQAKLKAKGITTRVYYPGSLHRLAHLNPLHRSYHLPQVTKAARQVVSIPVHPYLTDDEVEYIIRTIKSV